MTVCANGTLKTSQGDSHKLFAYSPLWLAMDARIHAMISVAVGYLQLMEHATHSFVRSVPVPVASLTTPPTATVVRLAKHAFFLGE